LLRWEYLGLSDEIALLGASTVRVAKPGA